MLEHLIAVCKSCGHTVRISIEHGGRRAKCPKCEGIIEIPKGETSIRLRSDLELTREARAKAGRGPESDPSAPAARTSKGATGRIHKKAAPAPKAKPKGKLPLILTVVATAIVLAGIVILLSRQSGNSAVSTPPPAPPAKKTPPPPPAPPPPPVDPHAMERAAILDRLDAFVKAFNSHNLNLMAPFYTADSTTLTRAFGALPVDTEVTYEKFEAKSIEFAQDEIKMTLIVDRVLTDTESGKSEKQSGVERHLVWVPRNEKWVISSPPEP